jgi:hypothetical protein
MVDGAFCIVFGLLGFRTARASQMVTQYRWLNESHGLMRWRQKLG